MLICRLFDIGLDIIMFIAGELFTEYHVPHATHLRWSVELTLLKVVDA